VRSRVAAAQIWITVVVLGAYGGWGLVDCWYGHAWVPAIPPAASVVAAAGVALRKGWSKLLVSVLTALFVGSWLLSVSLAISAGAFGGWSLSKVVISLLPGAFFSSLAVFCCAVVLVRFQAPHGQT
jgi:hypothetical protein